MDDRTRLRELIATYLDEAKMMQLATAIDGQPWVCTVWFAADKDLNIYWFSANTRRHSLELEHNNRVAAAIVLPQTPDDAPRGLQLQGSGSLLTEPAEIADARSHYSGRIFPDEKIDTMMAHSERPHRFYRITPTQFVLFDVVNFPDDPRRELNI